MEKREKYRSIFSDKKMHFILLEFLKFLQPKNAEKCASLKIIIKLKICIFWIHKILERKFETLNV